MQVLVSLFFSCKYLKLNLFLAFVKQNLLLFLQQDYEKVNAKNSGHRQPLKYKPKPWQGLCKRSLLLDSLLS